MMEQVKEALEKNNMPAYIVKDREEARILAMSMIEDDEVVGGGGSLTLDECGIRDELRKRGKFLDWWKPDIKKDEKDDILRKSLTCDVFLTGTNAVTREGKLYNIDGRGNRLAALIYGPKKVIVVAGKNKIVRNNIEAKERLETVAAPKNVRRLNKNTPCYDTGHCVDCRSNDRICSHTVISEWQQSDRIKVILVDEELGL